MHELTLREIQLGELEILKRIHEVCKEQNIQYYMHYGTLIGAIRHKGFIPWDDDIDIVMPRNDYQRFIEYMKKNAEAMKPLELMHHSVNKKYIYPIARVSDSRYKIEYAQAKDYGLGLFVDIYPMDGWGNTVEESQKIQDSFERLKKLVRLAGTDRFVPSPLGKFRSAVKRVAFHLFRFIGPHFFVNKMDKKGQKLKYDDYKLVGCSIWSASAKPAAEKEGFKPVELEFEACKFIGPEGYDGMLRKIYGDYMQLPSENDRIGHHQYKAYLKQADGIDPARKK